MYWIAFSIRRRNGRKTLLSSLLQLQGDQPNSEQVQMAKDTADYWRKVSDEAPVEALTRVEEAAKQLIGLTGALQGLYLAVFAFSDLRKQIGALDVPALGWLIWL